MPKISWRLSKALYRPLRFLRIVMIYKACAWLALVCALGYVLPPVRAQERLILYETRQGAIDLPNATQVWAFDGREGEMLSFNVQPQDTLDPQISVLDRDANVIISNDDATPETRAAILEGITIARTGSYTLVVGGYGGTTGAYTVALVRGYANVRHEERFNALGSWSSSNTIAEIAAQNGVLAVGLRGIGVDTFSTDANLSNDLRQFYAEMQVNVLQAVDGWAAGISVYQQAANGYAIMLNQRGQWRMIRKEGDTEQVLRDWSEHPAIRADQREFRLGVLANNGDFEVFYEGYYIGQVRDDNPLRGAPIGAYVRTGERSNATINAQFDDVFVTTPSLVPIFPTQLEVSTPQLTVQALQRRLLLPNGGELVFVVAESSTELNTAGVGRFMLGRGATFARLVIGTTLTVNSSAGDAGCGVVIHNVDDDTYTLAYLTRDGEYGLNARDGDVFQAGLYGQNATWAQGSHDLLLIADETRWHYYIDQRYVGTLQGVGATGTVGNAAINFSVASTQCAFRDTWVWRVGS
jgi:hypothetical protein